MAQIMVVDDSPTDVANLKRILEKARHEVSIAGDAADALQRIREEQPDAVLMDVVMPGVNGFQATRTLSRDPATAQIPVIVVSGNRSGMGAAPGCQGVSGQAVQGR